MTRLINAIAGETRSSDTFGLDEYIELFNFSGLNYPVGLRGSLGTSTEEIGRDFVGLVEGAYKQNGVIFACMMVRQLLFQEARFQFRRMKNGRPGEYFGTAALQPLEEPHVGGTTGDLLARMIQDVDLAGNWYGHGTRTGVHRLRPDFVTIIMGSKLDVANVATAPDVEVVGYMYSATDDEPEFYMPEEVAHYAPYPDPAANFRGMSWLSPVIREVMADQAATTHKLKYFEQGASPNMVVKFDPSVEEKKVEQWIALMEEQVGGVANAYKTLFLGGGADAQVVGSNLKDSNLKDIQGAGETRIAAAAGTPPVIVGLSEGLKAATYANYQSARRRFADGTMRPLWRNAAGSLANIIRVPPRAALWFDDRDIPFLQEDAQDRANIMQTEAATLQSLVSAGYTPESAKEAVLADDFGRLEHSGLVSVQLLPPGTKTTTKAAEVEPSEPSEEEAS
jgi:phage portal protein BeeE